MKKLTLAFILILLFGFFTINTSAQQTDKKLTSGKISGRIFDKLSSKPIQFAMFAVTSIKDSTKIYQTESDSSGRFSINSIPFGLYRAKVSLVGYQTRTRKNIILTPVKNELKIDTLWLMPLGITKEEVQVLAQKERIVYDKDNNNKITINPDKDWGVNALELLENTPMVHVDFDEKNITLMGKTGTQIFVNGMPGNYSGVENAEDLRLISSDEIDKFELIINPGTEYGIYSSGGVINIQLKKNNKTSYTGSTVLGGNSDNMYNTNLGGRYNSPTISAGLNYINGYADHTISNSLMRQLTFENTTDILNQSAQTDNRNIANRFSFNANLQLPNDLNIRNTTQYIEGYNTTDKNYQSNFSGNNFNNTAFSKNLLKLFSTGITFMKSLSEKQHRLNASFFYSNNQMNIENNYDQKSLLSFHTLADTTISGNDISDNSNKFINWGIYYGNMFNQYLNLSASYRGSYRGMIMNSDYFRYNPLTSSDVELTNKKIKQHNTDNTNYFNSGVSGKVIDIQYTFRMNANLKHSAFNNDAGNYSFKYNYISFDPIINLSANIADGHEIGLNYSSMTSFPQNYQLNPFTDYSDTTNIISGNPELKAGSNKAYSINYLFRNNFTSISLNGGYNLETDMVSSVITPIAPGITKTTFANVARQERYSVGISLYAKLFNCLELDPYFNLNKSKYSGIGVQNEGTSWGSFLYSMLSFSNLKLYASIDYSSASFNVQQKSKPEWSMDAGAKVLLFNKTLSITLRASDLFNSKNSSSTTYGTGIFMTNNVRQTTRTVSLSLSYFFKIEAQETFEPDIPFVVLPSEF